MCYRLLSDAIIDRLKRKEANSLITNFMLLLAFHFGVADIAIRMAVTFVLNVLVYFINDFIDVEIDLANEKKDHTKALYIKEHKRTAFALIVCVSAALLILTLLYSQSVCFGVILALLIIFLYTDYFKNMAYFDIIGCFVWGVSMAWPAIPDFSPQGIKLILLIGVFTASFEVVQCIKDYESDKQYDLRTTPIVIGIPKAFLLARSMYVLAAVYTVFVLGEIQGILLLAAHVLQHGPGNGHVLDEASGGVRDRLDHHHGAALLRLVCWGRRHEPHGNPRRSSIWTSA